LEIGTFIVVQKQTGNHAFNPGMFKLAIKGETTYPKRGKE
jgi:hypothetical protein